VWRVIDVEDWAEIRRLHRAEGMGIKAIARRLGVARNTVRDALRSDEPPRYERAGTGSAVDAVEPEIRRLLGEFPGMPATVIAERIGWNRGITVLRDRVAELRPLFVLPDPCQRTHYRPGELAQWDLWQPDMVIPVGFGQHDKLWVVVAVTGFSRLTGAWMVPTRAAHDVLGGMLQVLAQIGAVPRCAVWDQEGCIGQWRQGRQRLTDEFQAFRGVLGTAVKLCAPADPEAKGVVERANGYLETSFLPGRTFSSPADFNAQLARWLAVVNTRTRRALGCAPTERITADRQAMLSLPPVAPATGWRSWTRLARDHYIRLDGNDYSVHPAVIGRRIEIVADLDRVWAFCDGPAVADHPRVWARHQTISDPEHVAAARALRRDRIGIVRPVAEPQVEQRCLADYDNALGLDDTDGTVA
jgi:transposase